MKSRDVRPGDLVYNPNRSSDAGPFVVLAIDSSDHPILISFRYYPDGLARLTLNYFNSGGWRIIDEEV